jgi:hypothetical protein
LREERRLRVFENRVLRRIFGPRRNEVPLYILDRLHFHPITFRINYKTKRKKSENTDLSGSKLPESEIHEEELLKINF